jgi:hypothetical protein
MSTTNTSTFQNGTTYSRLTIQNWEKLYHITFDNPIRDSDGTDWLVTRDVLLNNTASPTDEEYTIPMINSPLQYYQVFVVYRTGVRQNRFMSNGDTRTRWVYETGWQGQPPTGWLTDEQLGHPDELLLHIERTLHSAKPNTPF